jgi:calcineurin-like phosphoesterase family protein
MILTWFFSASEKSYFRSSCGKFILLLETSFNEVTRSLIVVSSRRQFLKQLGLGVAAGAMGLPMFSSRYVMPAPEPETIRIALLADAHLPSASPETVAAQKLAAAVEEINAQKAPIDWVFFAGDLTDDGDNNTLELGRRILSGLDAPCVMLPGEHDISVLSGGLGQEIFDDGSFSFAYRGVYFLGCSTTRFNPATRTADFLFTPELQRRLSGTLTAISPETPLVLLSHAPCYRLFQPWQWWTEDSESLHALLKGRQKVYLLHGHVHQNITLHYQNLVFQGLRSTAWPLPDVRMGCGAVPPLAKEQDSSAGCGWMLMTVTGDGAMTLEDRVWT